MECQGRITNITKNFVTGKYNVIFEMDDIGITDAENLATENALAITVDKVKKSRSKNANALMWVCIQKIAEALRTSKWEVYLQMLKNYGQFTYVCVKPKAKEALMQEWRECEYIGPIEINGEPAEQLLCYFGSHTYDTKQFSVLLDGIISEMEQMGLQPPTSNEMKASLEEWERINAKHTAN